MVWRVLLCWLVGSVWVNAQGPQRTYRIVPKWNVGDKQYFERSTFTLRAQAGKPDTMLSRQTVFSITIRDTFQGGYLAQFDYLADTTFVRKDTTALAGLDTMPQTKYRPLIRLKPGGGYNGTIIQKNLTNT